MFLGQQRLFKLVEEWEKEEEEEFQERLDEIREYVDGLSPAEARQMLYDLLVEAEGRDYW